MKSWSIPAGHILGAEVRIHVTFLFLLIFVAIVTPVTGASVMALRSFALVGIVFASVVLHEIGHALVAAHAGLAVRSLVLLPLGGVCLFDDSPASTRPPSSAREMRVAAAGPIVSLAVAAAGVLLLRALAPEIALGQRPWVHAAHLARSVVWVNLVLGIVNLLPAYPLDGGRILRAFFARHLDHLRASRSAVNLGQLFAILFFILGYWNLWFTMIGLFLFFAAQLEERTLEFQSVLENVRMEDVMLTEFSTLSPADTLEHALSKAVHTLQDDFPVVRGNDMVGIISRQRILDALRLGGNAYVQSVMNSAFDVAHRTETLASAFRKITARNLSLIPVVDGEHLVGIVTLQNLMHSMGMLAESRKLRRDEEQ